nr:hypothetical protein [Nocardia cyriacigeorgica]
MAPRRSHTLRIPLISRDSEHDREHGEDAPERRRSSRHAPSADGVSGGNSEDRGRKIGADVEGRVGFGSPVRLDVLGDQAQPAQLAQSLPGACEDGGGDEQHRAFGEDGQDDAHHGEHGARGAEREQTIDGESGEGELRPGRGEKHQARGAARQQRRGRAYRKGQQ